MATHEPDHVSFVSVSTRMCVKSQTTALDALGPMLIVLLCWVSRDRSLGASPRGSENVAWPFEA
jgi:hypothetical protein